VKAPAQLGVSVADELLARNRALVNRCSQVVPLVMGIWFLRTDSRARREAHPVRARVAKAS